MCVWCSFTLDKCGMLLCWLKGYTAILATCVLILYQHLAELDQCHLCSQINSFNIVGKFDPAIPHMPTMPGMGFSMDGRMWLGMPNYGHPFAGLRDPISVVCATKKASPFRLLCHQNIIYAQDLSALCRSCAVCIISAGQVEYCVQAAIGLGQLHDKGYLHGDISPYNIAVTLAGDGTTTTTIIDLATLRRLHASQVST